MVRAGESQVTSRWAWLRRREELEQATHEYRVACAKAKASMAPWIVKTEIEWDFTGASKALDHTHKDEYLIALWTILTLSMLIPFVRDAAKDIHQDAPMALAVGWVVIFTATFGMKQFLAALLPGKIQGLIGAMNKVPAEIPDEAAKKAVKDATATKEE